MDKAKIKKVFLFFIALLILIVGVLVYSYLNDRYNIGIPCAVNKLFGLYCSGCGLTRAAGAMLDFDFYQAIRYNAFSIILLPLLLVFVISSIWEYIFNKSSFISKLPFSFWIVLFSAVFIYGVVRNFIPELQPIKL